MSSLENALQLAFYLAAAGQMVGLIVSRLVPLKAATVVSAEPT